MTVPPAGDIPPENETSAVNGEPAAAPLIESVYAELRALARSYLRRERPDHTLRPTALVHEAYLRLVGSSGRDWHDRTHFYASAAREMKRVLIDHARARGGAKRGGRWSRVTLDEGALGKGESIVDFLDLEEALAELEDLDPRACRAIELRFFGGMTVPETAHVLGVSHRTVEDDWRMARAWLSRRVKRTVGHDAG